MESIEFEEGIFNKIYFEIDKVFNTNSVRYCFIYGGSSASKTYSYCQRTIVYMLEGKNNNSLVFRKYSTDIDGSIFTTFKRIIADWQLQDYFIIQKHYIKCKLTGSYTLFNGLDDSEKIKGLDGVKKILLEEFNQFDLEDFKQVKKRLRGMIGQQVFGIFNPVSEMSFIKTEIFDKEILTTLPSEIQEKQTNETGDTVILRTCYLDNIWIVGPQFIDTHVIADFEKDKVNDINYYNIYALGNWGKLRTGGEFLKQFKSDKHVGNFNYNHDLPLHIVFDENVLPYVTCNVYQLQNNILTQIDEIMLEDPRNTLKETCEEFIKRYGSNGQGLFVYGDATSKKNDSKLQKGYNFYKLIQNYLSLMRPTFKVPMANPAVINSKQFVNDIFLDEVTGVKLRFDVNCKKSINDYQYCTEDADGKVNKSTIKNKVTGQSYQRYGHACDALRYIVYMIYHKEYRKWIINGCKKPN